MTWARCRGVGFYELPAVENSRPGSSCARRIFTSTVDSRLIALDAATGQPCADFGKNGIVDLKADMGLVDPGYYTGPPRQSSHGAASSSAAAYLTT